MTTTDHAARLIESLHDWQGQEGQTDASMLTVVLEAQVHATLALVAEQRVANQLALLEHLPPHSAARDQLVDEIRARLTVETSEDSR